MASSIWAITWFVKLVDITKLGWPVAQPRFSSRPSARISTLWPSGNTNWSYWGLMLVRLMPGIFFRPAMSISLSKWPMLPTMALSFIRAMCSAVMIPVLPVAVMKMSAVADHVLERQDLVALHRRLQRADGVDLGDDHARALALERLRAALAHVAVAADDRDLARQHHVGGAA